MTDGRIITDADLFDYLEGRSSAERRACLSARLRSDSGLRAKLARIRERAQQLRALRQLIPAGTIPQDWLDLLASAGRR
jgi:anti-sigma factor RsiW